jgi:hypothetical protein
VSLLLTKAEGNFLKKATGRTFFTCRDGALLQQTVAQAVETGTPQPVTVHSTGVDNAGNSIAEFLLTWSFKAKR